VGRTPRERPSSKSLEHLAEQFGINLTKSKLGHAVTGVGLALGGGYNSWYLSRVSEWAYFTYRDSHLIDRT
jgi:hypothetical protein